MLRYLISKLRTSREGERSDRVSILLPFLIISAGLGVLAWRSHQLSVKMEGSAKTVAIRYAGYAAEISAQRVDAAVKEELARAEDDWQGIERRDDAPVDRTFREWVHANDWMIEAIHIPDFDPASSVYVLELGGKENRQDDLTREFFTSTGTVRFTYDPVRLLSRVEMAVKQQPLIRATAQSLPMQQAVVSVVRSDQKGLVSDEGRFVFFAPLSAPLADFAIRASVGTAVVGAGWESQRAISLLVSLVALLLTGVGAFLALRGLAKESETMKLRSALIANVSHELRTPLSMIRLGAETLKRGARLTPKDRADIEDQILREVLHLSHLVENVLDVARMQHPNARALAFTPVDPRNLVTTLVSTYESWIRSKGFQIDLKLDESVEPQMWEREAVSRALLNLIDNAIKYSSDHTTIEVVLGQTPEHVALEVRDRGVGIDNRDLSRIFDPYYRAAFSDTQTRRGAGLGLTLVRQIVESHGGKAEVESQPGSGSTFRLLFPRATPEESMALRGEAIETRPLVTS
ncbi:MAG TPA: HAMP domain-containing sensor histidine kinase [Thermoanaerobaculia bacterium]|nr:HAMP domain-containing sensor histidine kinase [Thermoanaerobaculia bacterium]